MRVCLTGGAGMIGSTLLRKLVALGHDVVVIDNLWRGSLSNVSGIDGFSYQDSLRNIDLAQSENVNGVIEIFEGCDTVIHLADIVAGIGYVFNNQYEIFRVNNLINTNVFNACAEAKVKKIIYAGTACSFPKDLQLSLESVLKEDQLFPAEPESAYGWSKLMGSLELQFLQEKYGCEVTTLMLHNVYGPFCDIDAKRSQVIPSIIRKMLELKEGEDLTVWGSGNQGRAFLHTEDVARAFLSALEKSDLPLIIQVGPNKCTSIKELVTTLKNDVLKKDINIIYDTTKPEGDIGRCADYSLANSVLGWTPSVDFVQGLTETVNWVKGKLKREFA